MEILNKYLMTDSENNPVAYYALIKMDDKSQIEFKNKEEFTDDEWINLASEYQQKINAIAEQEIINGE